MANPHGVPQVSLPSWLEEVRSEYGELAVGELADLEVVVTGYCHRRTPVTGARS